MIKKIIAYLFLYTALFANDWQTATSLNTPRHGASAVELDGFIYVLGGATTGGAILNSVERFNPATGIWEDNVVPSFEKPRLDAAAIVYEGSIYLMGGLNHEGEVTKDVEVYLPSQNTWIESGEMRRERRGHSAFIVNDSICVLGGIRDNGEFVSEIEWYNAPEERWEEAESNIAEPIFKPFGGAANNSVFLLGGIVNFPVNKVNIGMVNSDWQFNWNSGAPLQVARGNGASTVFGDSILMIGGITSTSAATNLVEIYNMQTDSIETLPPLPTARIGAVAVTISDTVYVIGGYESDPNQPGDVVEQYPLKPLVSIASPNDGILPQEFAQIKGFPNPFNGVIQLEIQIPRRGSNELIIYDIRGKKIQTLHSGALAAGRHFFQWTAQNEAGLPVATGIYLAVLKSRRYLEKFKIVYVR